MKLIIRKHDKKTFRASYPDWWTEADAIDDLIAHSTPKYYFREIVPTNKKWWQFWKKDWRDTGRIWEPWSEKDFDVINM